MRMMINAMLKSVKKIQLRFELLTIGVAFQYGVYNRKWLEIQMVP